MCLLSCLKEYQWGRKAELWVCGYFTVCNNSGKVEMRLKFSILLKFPYSLFTGWSHCLSPQVCRIFAFPVCLWERDPTGECGWCLALAWTTRDQVQHFYEQDCQKLSKSSVSRWSVEYKGDLLRAGSKDRKQGNRKWKQTIRGRKRGQEEKEKLRLYQRVCCEAIYTCPTGLKKI